MIEKAVIVVNALINLVLDIDFLTPREGFLFHLFPCQLTISSLQYLA